MFWARVVAGGVDAHDLSLHVHERAAGVPVVDGGVRLDDVAVRPCLVGAARLGIAVRVLRRDRPVERGDDAGRDGRAALERERVPQRHDPLPQHQVGGVRRAATVGMSFASIFRTARSCRQSEPITRASNCSGSASDVKTVIFEAASTTWQFVTMTPSDRTMNPVPTPWPLPPPPWDDVGRHVDDGGKDAFHDRLDRLVGRGDRRRVQRAMRATRVADGESGADGERAGARHRGEDAEIGSSRRRMGGPPMSG